MTCGAFLFALMSACAHSQADRCGWTTVAAARCITPMILSGLMAASAGAKVVVLNSRILWLRSIAGSVSLIAGFYALSKLPVSDVLTLSNLFPLWVAILSWPLFRRSPDPIVWPCTVLGLVGVVLVQQPHFVAGNHATVFALLSSVMSAVAVLGLHHLKHLDPRSIVFHFSMTALLASLAAGWSMDGGRLLSDLSRLQPDQIAPLLGVGLFATGGQFCLTHAFTHGAPAKVSVVGLSQVGFALLFDLLFFQRQLGWLTVAGMTLVLAPTAWLLLRERRIIETAD
jgi:drug/metabolite transporter (DMT)-like permease